jgi:hypothetical protein
MVLLQAQRDQAGWERRIYEENKVLPEGDVGWADRCNRRVCGTNGLDEYLAIVNKFLAKYRPSPLEVHENKK